MIDHKGALIVMLIFGVVYLIIFYYVWAFKLHKYSTCECFSDETGFTFCDVHWKKFLGDSE